MNRLFVLLYFIASVASAQDGHYELGGRNNALGGASVTLDDHWAISNNVGALGSLHETTAFLDYRDQYGISGFRVIGGGFVHSTNLATIGAKYFKFGDDLFSQQLVGLTLANRFQKVSLGLGIDLVQIAAENLQTQRTIIMEFGGRVEISRKLFFGAYLSNLKNTDENPTVMKAGLSFLPLETLQFNLEVEKQLNSAEKCKAGMEYQVLKLLFLRTGINVQKALINSTSVRSSFGFGVHQGPFQIDYAFIGGNELGVIHDVSLSYQPRIRK